MKKITLIVALFVGVLTYAQNEMKIVKQGDIYKVTCFHENGKIAQTGFLDADKQLHGTWVSYDIEGNKKSTGAYENGKKVGTWFFGHNKDLAMQVDFGANSKVTGVYQLKSNKSQLADSDTEEE